MHNIRHKDTPSPDDMTTKTAEQVAAIPELLEAILLELPPIDLLFAQRVSTTFRDTIHSSANIRRVLLYEEAAVKDESLTVQPPLINPFIGRIFDLADQGATTGNQHCYLSMFRFSAAVGAFRAHLSRSHGMHSKHYSGSICCVHLH